jgi:hypothetical protein
VALGSARAGLLPWSSGGSAWLGWRYPFPRPVAALALFLPPDTAPPPSLMLFRHDPGPDDFLAVLTRFETVEGIVGTPALLLVVEVRADEVEKC